MAPSSRKSLMNALISGAINLLIAVVAAFAVRGIVYLSFTKIYTDPLMLYYLQKSIDLTVNYAFFFTLALCLIGAIFQFCISLAFINNQIMKTLKKILALLVTLIILGISAVVFFALLLPLTSKDSDFTILGDILYNRLDHYSYVLYIIGGVVVVVLAIAVAIIAKSFKAKPVESTISAVSSTASSPEPTAPASAATAAQPTSQPTTVSAAISDPKVRGLLISQLYPNATVLTAPVPATSADAKKDTEPQSTDAQKSNTGLQSDDGAMVVNITQEVLDPESDTSVGYRLFSHAFSGMMVLLSLFITGFVAWLAWLIYNGQMKYLDTLSDVVIMVMIYSSSCINGLVLMSSVGRLASLSKKLAVSIIFGIASVVMSAFPLVFAYTVMSSVTEAQDFMNCIYFALVINCVLTLAVNVYVITAVSKRAKAVVTGK